MSENIVLHMPAPKVHKPLRAPRLLLFLVALLLLAGGVTAWLYTGKMETSADIQGDYLPIAPLMTARVTEVLVKEGQMVRAGQPLARLDNSALNRMEADARALVRGTRHTMEDTANRVASAQAAEEYTVRRVALARHEEETLRRQVEQRAQDHARAQLHMRNLDAKGTPMTAQSRREAQQAEAQAQSQRETAINAFEFASRARAAVEGELLKVKQETQKSRAQGYAASSLSSGSLAAGGLVGVADPAVITAPQDGRILGKLPAPGQMLARGETILRLAPDGNTALWGVAHVSQELASKVRPGQVCFVLPQHASNVMLVGEVEEVAGIETDPTRHDVVPLRIRITDSNAGGLSAQMVGRPARVIIWGNSLPGMRQAAPLLARWGIL